MIAQITPSNRPVRIFKSFLSFSAGASYITFHPEATNHVDRSLSLIRNAGLKSGLVFNPSTSLDYLKYVMDKVDIVLLMSVNPGFGGQKFIPSVLAKAREARKLIDESVNPPPPDPAPPPHASRCTLSKYTFVFAAALGSAPPRRFIAGRNRGRRRRATTSASRSTAA